MRAYEGMWVHDGSWWWEMFLEGEYASVGYNFHRKCIANPSNVYLGNWRIWWGIIIVRNKLYHFALSRRIRSSVTLWCHRWVDLFVVEYRIIIIRNSYELKYIDSKHCGIQFYISRELIKFADSVCNVSIIGLPSCLLFVCCYVETIIMEFG